MKYSVPMRLKTAGAYEKKGQISKSMEGGSLARDIKSSGKGRKSR